MVEKNDILLLNIPFDLQRFASAESEGRTEKATEHKKRKAREEGRVALSKEIPAVAVAIAAFGTMVILGKYIFKVLRNSFVYIFENYQNLSLHNPKLYFDTLIFPMVKLFLPMAIVAFVVALVSNYGQIGGMKFYSKPLIPDFKRVNPNIFKFFQKQVFSPIGAFNLLKSIVKVVIIVAVAFFVIKSHIMEIMDLFNMDISAGFIFMLKVCVKIVFFVMILMLIFSIADVFFVHKQHEEELKMKKEEVKQEFKDLEGDPQVKSKLKQMYQSLLSQQKILNDIVPQADVVITNPTHFAVALRYDRVVDDVPRVIAKGQDEFAQKIKKVAAEHGIYLYENVPLARKLYADVKINDYVPETMWTLVVTALKLAYEHKEKMGEGR
ncbi:MAG: flagellar type III secretion system protein FlhB [Spirochaetales bacterium]|nr:flagellar type III secretion system protein FlhB [Spirochaetales bacterium]